MKYLLDTNVCIKYLNADLDQIMNHLKDNSPNDIALCSIVKSELLAGAYKSKVAQKNLSKLQVFFEKFSSISFDDSAADKYGKIRTNLEKKGTIIGPYDLQIASIALVHDLILVTHNTKEFERVPGLKLEDWEL
jgi:tRNA(fMet)-specific endonuclease VapC